MRYQQMFASLAIREQLRDGATSGVVWHTQGSGKTALSYYLTYVLSDYYAKHNMVAKFYFIVDRIDLLEQATQEFEARGLVVSTANTRAELMAQFRNNHAQEGNSGHPEITVVNIQRFAEDKEKVNLPAYAINLQRIFIMDEAHRGYKPGGCFLANLFDADPDSVKIALTGTPLLKSDCASSVVFQRYFHTYYYDRSIADGYTLKIIREDIETSYKERLSEVYDKLETLVQKKDIKRSQIIEHESYVNELAHYISDDLRQFRKIQGDETLGGMVICETSEQARKLYEAFQHMPDGGQTQTIQIKMGDQVWMAAEAMPMYGTKKKPLRVGLILHDSDDKETRKQIIKDFKKNMSIDLLIVFNMLLTGFDAPRLKRLYFGRKLKDHNLLQALTRVNRPYKDNRYGYVIDFANIKRNFEETNEAYLKELNRFNNPDEVDGDHTTDTFSQVIEDPEELIRQMRDVRQTLFDYTTNNVEEFSSEISSIEDKQVLLDLKKTLISAKDCANIVRTFGDDDLKEAFGKLEITRLPDMLKEVQHHIDIINQKEAFAVSDETKQLVNEAMQDIRFNFSKIGEEEMKMIAGGRELQDKWSVAIRKFTENTDPDDPEYITLRDAFMQRFKEHGFVVDSIAKFNQESKELDEIIERLVKLQESNNRLLKKYNGDTKFANVHKRIREENKRRFAEHKAAIFSYYDDNIVAILTDIKSEIDQKVYDRNDILKKDEYFEMTVMTEIAQALYNYPTIEPQMDDFSFIQTRIARQYINQYNATYPRN